ncbi:MAG: peptidoglycan DD-metalloendopeptidase family protein [Bacteroidetes bacterium]|jgi:murein DD-endopeptidase MepM/ murein hydrolase activator NlpD|nr:peptidoglycan DD-metalloendopeptidase family protein [Bacteroidota bacterium]
MAKNTFKYNPETLTFEKYKVPTWYRVFKGLGFLAIALVFSIVNITVYSYFFPTPKEQALNKQVEILESQLKSTTAKIQEQELVLGQLVQRDENLYRVILQAEPNPESLWEGGIGGVNHYAQFEGMPQKELLVRINTRLRETRVKLARLSQSYDELASLATTKEDRLTHIPAIQPVNNENLKWLSSGYGYRFHPILKIRKFHFGADFAAPTGTEIYATGDGVVEKAKYVKGYGNHVVVNHGFGYQTLYGHMSKIAVRRGQKIKRGELLGYVGNTGLSSAPHLHYEVIKNGKKVNPVHYFNYELNPDEYETILNLSKQSNQSFD